VVFEGQREVPLLRAASTKVLLAVPFFLPSLADGQPAAQAKPIAVTTLSKIGTVSPRFQSFNIEMVEVTGGRFWAPYKKQGEPQPKSSVDSSASVPAGMDPSLYRYRPPIDLSNPKLRKLAAALAPSYVRVSGTWANSTYFQDSDAPAPPQPPAGFGTVLTRKEWKGVINFSKAVDANIVTSFAVSTGVRDSNGVWTPVEAKKILAFTRANGDSIAAAEMFNEPTFASISNVPKGYDAQAYGRDYKAFHAYIAKAAPKMTILGPGTVGELGFNITPPTSLTLLKTTDLLDAAGTEGLDAFSYHFYGGVSQRCQPPGQRSKDTIATALTPDWLNRTNRDEAFYSALRDKYLPGKPLWLTETGEAACGGDPWASTFLDSFRYLNQLGTLARSGVQVVIHNTLAASDYALIDEDTLTPRPNYWSALLWRRMMGTTVLDAGSSDIPGVYVYAHCLRNQPGGVAILAINADRDAAHEVTVPEASMRYTLASDNLTTTQVALNGVDLVLDNKGNLPTLTGTPTPAGKVTLAPTTITFLGVAKANNAACRK
jgi:heparanase 1